MISGFRRELDENCDFLCYYHYSLRNNPDGRSSQDGRSGACWLKYQDYPYLDLGTANMPGIIENRK